MRRLAGGLALLIALAGCSPAGAPRTTAPPPAASPTTTSTPTTAPPPTTTEPLTPTTHAVTDYGDGLFVEEVPLVLPGQTTAVPGAYRPRITYAGRNTTWANQALRAFTTHRVGGFGPSGPPEGYSLGFTVLWTGSGAQELLTIVFAEALPSADGGTPVAARAALLFDLTEGEQLTAAGMLTPAGVTTLAGLVTRRVQDAVDEGFCCPAPENLVADIGVLPEGLAVYLDETDGLPYGTEPLEFLLSWSVIAPLVDMRQPHLAGFAVAEGLCSASGQQWAPADQTGLPAAVAAKRSAIFAAAAACDYEGLEDLAGQGEGFTGPLGNGVHPGTAEAFRDGEVWGRASLWWLLTTLNLPYAARTYTYGDGTSWTGYVWPAAQDMLLAEIPADLRADLEAIYPRPLEEYGYRTGALEHVFAAFHVDITPEAEWVWVGSNPE